MDAALTNEDVINVIIGIVALGFLLAYLAFSIYFTLQLQRALSRLPVEHREMEPALVWLNFIPCFSLYWAFRVYPGVPNSLRLHFASSGRGDPVGPLDTIGIVIALLELMSWVPYVGSCFTLVAIGLKIHMLVQIRSIVAQLDDAPNAAEIFA